MGPVSGFLLPSLKRLIRAANHDLAGFYEIGYVWCHFGGYNLVDLEAASERRFSAPYWVVDCKSFVTNRRLICIRRANSRP